ncbi:hypothetical protein SAMN05444358_102257 [Ruegeria halocynthiae]|uniref:(S)-ureidoglycine aminohydrolase cupin domain-containing protein n=1 Tax=Ruegeria halocynthiae TaxID=985054 RepID=A0A1H2YEZ0_9RHOB|nr:cupin domain-containing protein [Ruegeria halocynthiae]SDX03630.1 hypothetical protein SAMN05444358_102257 [Ruegeria halocynthiae]
MGVLNLKKLPEIAEDQLEDWGAVPEPIDSEPSLLRGLTLAENEDGSEVGVWTCTPGKWRRKIQDAEMCYFTHGSCTYTDEQGNVTEINAGDMVYFPAMSLGIWEIKEHSRNAYITYKSK